MMTHNETLEYWQNIVAAKCEINECKLLCLFLEATAMLVVAYVLQTRVEAFKKYQNWEQFFIVITTLCMFFFVQVPVLWSLPWIWIAAVGCMLLIFSFIAVTSACMAFHHFWTTLTPVTFAKRICLAMFLTIVRYFQRNPLMDGFELATVVGSTGLCFVLLMIAFFCTYSTPPEEELPTHATQRMPDHNVKTGILREFGTFLNQVAWSLWGDVLDVGSVLKRVFSCRDDTKVE